MKVLVVEDDYIAFDIVETLLRKHGVQSIDHSTSVENATEKLQQEKYDLLILDIHLDDGNGTEVIEYVPTNTNVIFVTSDPTYAVEAFEVNALDYLLKPVTEQRFAAAMNKFTDLKGTPTILIKADFQYYKIPVADIQFIKSNKDYLTLYTALKRYTFFGRIKNFVFKVPAETFMQCHRSFIINLDKVSSFNQNSVVIDKIEIQVSSQYKKEVAARIAKKMVS
jgi:DNA-binding LytR/AlgR family response regulator